MKNFKIDETKSLEETLRNEPLLRWAIFHPEARISDIRLEERKALFNGRNFRQAEIALRRIRKWEKTCSIQATSIRVYVLGRRAPQDAATEVMEAVG